MPEVTYGQLEEVLRALGFSLRGIVKQNKLYRHEGTGAVVSFPDLPADDPVMQHHLVAARMVLDANGIADPLYFADQLQKAS